jgi:hypothetical protein
LGEEKKYLPFRQRLLPKTKAFVEKKETSPSLGLRQKETGLLSQKGRDEILPLTKSKIKKRKLLPLIPHLR